MTDQIYDPVTSQRRATGSLHLPETARLPLAKLVWPQLGRMTFTLTAGSLCLYTGALFEGLAKVLKLPGEPANVQLLVARYSHLPRQHRLQQLAHGASRLDCNVDDLTILLIEHQGVSPES